MPAAKVSVLILAAGASSRMGGTDKLLVEKNGVPMLQHSVAAAMASRAFQVLAVTAATHPGRRELVQRLGTGCVEVADSSAGMSASIRAGMAAVSGAADAVIIALGDMPDVVPEHFDRLIAAFSARNDRDIFRALSEDGRTGHPVLFGRRFFYALSELQGDTGARDLISAVPELVAEVPTAGFGAIRDIDAPPDLEDWLEP